jgi:hypothetical protein
MPQRFPPGVAAKAAYLRRGASSRLPLMITGKADCKYGSADQNRCNHSQYPKVFLHGISPFFISAHIIPHLTENDNPRFCFLRRRRYLRISYFSSTNIYNFCGVDIMLSSYNGRSFL